MDSLRSITARDRHRIDDVEDSLDKIEEDLEENEAGSHSSNTNVAASATGMKQNASTNSLSASKDKKLSTLNVNTASLNYKLKNQLLQSINLMIEDIESVHDMITDQAKEHIHSNDVILTYGRSNIIT